MKIYIKCSPVRFTTDTTNDILQSHSQATYCPILDHFQYRTVEGLGTRLDKLHTKMPAHASFKFNLHSTKLCS